jgi:hypothetical protein
LKNMFCVFFCRVLVGPPLLATPLRPSCIDNSGLPRAPLCSLFVRSCRVVVVGRRRPRVCLHAPCRCRLLVGVPWTGAGGGTIRGACTRGGGPPATLCGRQRCRVGCRCCLVRSPLVAHSL